MRGNEKIQKLILKAVESIVDATHPQKVILFGSYANGNPTIHSDVDLLVIKEDKLPRIERSVFVGKILKHLEKELPFDITDYTPSEVKSALDEGDPFLEDILREGDVLYG